MGMNINNNISNTVAIFIIAFTFKISDYYQIWQFLS